MTNPPERTRDRRHYSGTGVTYWRVTRDKRGEEAHTLTRLLMWRRPAFFFLLFFFLFVIYNVMYFFFSFLIWTSLPNSADFICCYLCSLSFGCVLRGELGVPTAGRGLWLCWTYCSRRGWKKGVMEGVGRTQGRNEKRGSLVRAYKTSEMEQRRIYMNIPKMSLFFM